MFFSNIILLQKNIFNDDFIWRPTHAVSSRVFTFSALCITPLSRRKRGITFFAMMFAGPRSAVYYYYYRLIGTARVGYFTYMTRINRRDTAVNHHYTRLIYDTTISSFFFSNATNQCSILLYT